MVQELRPFFRTPPPTRSSYPLLEISTFGFNPAATPLYPCIRHASLHLIQIPNHDGTTIRLDDEVLFSNAF